MALRASQRGRGSVRGEPDRRPFLNRTLGRRRLRARRPRINVAGDGVDLDFTIVVGLNNAGECRYFVGEAEYPGWEIRKMALEALFFEVEEEGI